MIIDLRRFIAEESRYWRELEAELDKTEGNPDGAMSMARLKRFHYLYRRASSGLSKLTTFSAEPRTIKHLESLVSRAYAQVHETRSRKRRTSPLKWFFGTLPRTFRRHVAVFWLSVAITCAGMAFGSLSLSLDHEARRILIPFDHLIGSPSERVKQEERATEDRLKGRKMSGTSMYFTHNTKVGIMTATLGATWGIGTITVLFYNGVILGAVAVDYVLSDETVFLLAWLMPHGVVEIPAILIAGQAGLVLAGALIGWGNRKPLGARFREVRGDIVTLCLGVAVLLGWAGFIEAFVSQYHEPILPYYLKILFGSVELVLLVLFLSKAGAGKGDAANASFEGAR